MIYGWIIGGLTTLDLGVKSVAEDQEGEMLPRELSSAKGLIGLRENHNSGFPSGFMKERPELARGIPLMVVSAMAGALAAMMQDKGKIGEKLGLSLVMGGVLSSLCDHVMRGHAVDYFIIEWKSLRKVVSSPGDMFVLSGSTVFVLAQAVKSLEETGVKKKRR